MSKFKVGDRVVFYNSQTFNHQGIDYWGALSCTVIEVDVVWATIKGYMMVKDAYGKHHYAHPNQCRKLVKKKKEKLGRELWFCRTNGDGDFIRMFINPDRIWDEVIHVREILDE